MPRLEDGREGEFAMRRVPGCFYVSSRFPAGGGDGSHDADEPAICRYAYQVIASLDFVRRTTSPRSARDADDPTGIVVEFLDKEEKRR